MKTYTLIFLILFASVIVILKLITSQNQINTTEDSIEMMRANTESIAYQQRDEADYKQDTNNEIDKQELQAFAKAFVDVQSYMHKAGNNVRYSETSRIVQKHGLSVEKYTKIASQINMNSVLKNKVQQMINKAN